MPTNAHTNRFDRTTEEAFTHRVVAAAVTTRDRPTSRALAMTLVSAVCVISGVLAAASADALALADVIWL